MIVPDVNLLLYAHDRRSAFHEPASAWWGGLMNGTELVGLPWAVSLGFVRLVTQSRLLENPLLPDQAIGVVSRWFDAPHVRPLVPGANHLTIMNALLSRAGVAGKLVPDAHIAALAIEHRATVHSHDRDFQRFSGVRLFDPLA